MFKKKHRDVMYKMTMQRKYVFFVPDIVFFYYLYNDHFYILHLVRIDEGTHRCIAVMFLCLFVWGYITTQCYYRFT